MTSSASKPERIETWVCTTCHAGWEVSASESRELRRCRGIRAASRRRRLRASAPARELGPARASLDMGRRTLRRAGRRLLGRLAGSNARTDVVAVQRRAPRRGRRTARRGAIGRSGDSRCAGGHGATLTVQACSANRRARTTHQSSNPSSHEENASNARTPRALAPAPLHGRRGSRRARLSDRRPGVG